MCRSIQLVALLCVLAAIPLSAQSNSPNSVPSNVQGGVQTGAETGVQTAPTVPSVTPGFDSLARPTIIASPLTQPTLSPGVILLMELEGRFAQSVATGGGKAFASWFADDAVTLNNGRPAVLGRASIAAKAQWDPKSYQLTWTPQGAQMGPSNDMGFTWGHYEGRSTDKNGQPVIVSGRYFTVWKKLPDGSWKVALDASSNEPPVADECCALPKP
jgi:ketosteroid isomerase-like protein